MWLWYNYLPPSSSSPYPDTRQRQSPRSRSRCWKWEWRTIERNKEEEKTVVGKHYHHQQQPKPPTSFWPFKSNKLERKKMSIKVVEQVSIVLLHESLLHHLRIETRRKYIHLRSSSSSFNHWSTHTQQQYSQWLWSGGFSDLQTFLFAEDLSLSLSRPTGIVAEDDETRTGERGSKIKKGR